MNMFFALQTPNSCASSISSCAAAGGIGAAVTGKVSRKDKSLGLLCDKFISRYEERVLFSPLLPLDYAQNAQREHDLASKHLPRLESIPNLIPVSLNKVAAVDFSSSPRSWTEF